jgi:hypothetical protein
VFILDALANYQPKDEREAQKLADTLPSDYHKAQIGF